MSHRKHSRRRSAFGLELLETRKLAANMTPTADAGIDTLAPEKSATLNWMPTQTSTTANSSTAQYPTMV